MSQDIPNGTPWRDWIKTELKNSDLLLVLFSGPSRDWNWCNYEIGLFTPLTDRPEKPIVCIHPPEQLPPDPIDDLQSLPCKIDELQDFFGKLFEGHYSDGVSINSAAAQNESSMREIATRIHEERAHHGESDNRLYYTRHITIKMLSEDNEPPELTEDAIITGDRLSLEIFGIVQRSTSNPWTWGSFKEYLSKSAQNAGADSDRLLGEFVNSVNSACKDEMISPSDFRIASLSSGKRYQPVIHRRDSYYDGTYRIRVLFIQIAEEGGRERNLTLPTVNGGVKVCHWGGAKVGQLLARLGA